MCKGEQVLLQALELIGKDWEENYRPEVIRLDEQKVDLLLQVRSLAEDPGGAVTFEVIRDRAPTFVDQYRLVTLKTF